MTPYDAALQSLGEAGLDLSSGTFQILYLTSGYTVDLDTHSTEADLGANISHRETLSNVTWTSRVFDADDLTVTDPDNGETVTQIVIVKGSAAAGANPLVCHQALSSSVTWDGTNDSQTFNASGIFRIGAA